MHYSDLHELSGAPGTWAIRVDGQAVLLTTDQLFNHKEVRRVVAVKLGRIIPPMKPREWDSILTELEGQRMAVVE